MADNLKEKRDKLLNLIRDAVATDKELREKYQVGDKFRFIRDHLNNVLTQAEESLALITTPTEKQTAAMSVDEVIVYVYLYNSQGLSFKTWQKMLSPSVFYEYSVNRPIYKEKIFVETFIRYKPNRSQHAYLSVAIKKDQVLDALEPVQDTNNNPVIKIKEGSLKIEKLLCFTHNENDYVLNEVGELVRKV